MTTDNEEPLDSLYNPSISDLELDEYQGLERPVIYLDQAKAEIERIVNEARTTEALAILFLVEDESSQIIIKERIKVLEAQLSSKDKQK